MGWVEKYQETGKIDRHSRQPISYKVKKEHVNFMIHEIRKNKTITIYDLIEKLKEKFNGLSLSNMHVHRIIRDNNITLKITRLRHEPVKRFGKDIDINKNKKPLKNYL